MADMKVCLDDKKDSYFYYPDLLLSCDPDDRESAYYRRNPCLIVEIASTSVNQHRKLITQQRPILTRVSC
jgi:Uma2 family endonuclease